MLGSPERKIGNIIFAHPPIILAPMEDVSDPPFRAICRTLGADWVFSEFISAEGLIRDSAKSNLKLYIFPGERPVSIQIFGADISAMIEAAKIVESVQPDFIDINFGCPVRKVATKGAGAGMLQNIPKMLEMTRSIVKAVKLPVTVKTRLGWDEQSKNIVDIAEQLQDTGIAALTIHGRTRCQLFGGRADWSLIGEVKNNPRMHIPIIGNGDIINGQSARVALDKYGVDGIMIGRASIGNPWIFAQVKQFITNGLTTPPPTIAERADICMQHIEMSVPWKGEKLTLLEMRKHYSLYFKGITNFKPFRGRLVTAQNIDEVRYIIDEIRSFDFEAR